MPKFAAVFFDLEDGTIGTLEDATGRPRRRRDYVPWNQGDLVHLECRPSIILACASTLDEALQQARVYYTELARIDGWAEATQAMGHFFDEMQFETQNDSQYADCSESQEQGEQATSSVKSEDSDATYFSEEEARRHD